ncbi:hypothetical protein PQR57_35335 [Paraburkholderia dipogonis]|uniref:Transposase n=1 Tax=Paraburkholderia dipogonis TaxID=1211383 RepID=A0ABW9B066_9BURK
MVEELLAGRGIDLAYETVRRWSVSLGLGIARRGRFTALARGNKWLRNSGMVMGFVITHIPFNNVIVPVKTVTLICM